MMETAMPTVTLQTIHCIRSASGIDAGVFDAFANLPETIVPSELSVVIDGLKAIPDVLAAIDTARSDPDDLYVTTGTSGDRDLAIWPGPGQDVEMQPDQSVAPNIAVDFETSQNFSLFDHDTISDDDHLGSITVFASEQGQGEIGKRASSAVEGSAYYIMYRVD
jgi:hypothetical protein